MPLATPLTFTMTHEARQQAGLFASWLDTVLDYIFPPRCAGCGRVDTAWCSTCQQEIDLLPYAPAVIPGDASSLSAIASTGQHAGKLRLAVHSLKFEASPELALPLGERLYTQLSRLQWRIDMLVPVPLHTQRLQERGYNQSQLLCEAIAAGSGIAVLAEALHRRVATRSQVGLSAAQRQENVHDAFVAEPQQVSNQTILLVDDVYTTGATLGACAQALINAGASRVYGLTVTSA